MKNKFKIFLCVTMIFVFSFGTCATAYASTGQPKDIDTAWNIVKSYYLDATQDASSSFYFSNDFSPVLLYSSGGKSFLLVDVKGQTNYSFFNNGEFGLLSCPKVFSFDDLNMYSKPSGVYSHFWGGPYSLAVPDLTFDNFSSGSTVILGSKYDILSPSGELVFQQGTSQSPNPNPPTPPSASDSNILSTIFNKNSAMLNGVLNEIIALLPLLIPLLISLLSIRKGIKFTLKTLRSV